MTTDDETIRPRPARTRTYKLSRLWRRPPLLVHLMGFAFIVLAPALLFSAFLVLQFSQQQKEIAARQVAETAESLSGAVDREILQLVAAGRVMASSSFIDDDDVIAFGDRAAGALTAVGADALLIDSSLRVVADTRRPTTMLPEPLADSTAAESTFRDRRTTISGVFFDDVSRDFVFHVLVPVRRGDRVTHVLAVSKRTRDLGLLVADMNLPQAWIAVAKDQTGHKVFAASASAGHPGEAANVSFDNPSVTDIFGKDKEGDMIEASYRSAVSQWTTSIAVPDAQVGRPIMRSWMLLVGTGTLLLFFSAGLAVFFGRRLARPILLLAVQARAIGKGEPALPIGTDIEEVGDVSKVLAQASRDRRDSEEQNRFLMREMAHRARNQYALIAAIARRAAKESADTTEFLATLSEALGSLARSADLLAADGWDSASLSALAASQLKAFGAGRGDHIVMAGPAIRLSPAAAQTIGLALHELATNAAKYGALSIDEGHVRIEWTLAEAFSLSWTEKGGPPVVAPKRSGFGTLVTQKMTARGLGGTVEMQYARSGVVWRLTAPKEMIVAG